MEPQYQPQPSQSPTPAPQPVAPGAYAPQPQVSAPAMPEAPADYLNRIAGSGPVKKASPVAVFGLIGGVIAVLIIIMVVMIQAAAPPNVNSQLYALQARIDTLIKVTDAQSKSLTQNELATINSTLGGSLNSINTSLTSYTKQLKLTTGDKGATAAKKAETTYADALSKKLSDAYLLGTLDRTYSTEMKYQLSILKSKIQQIKSRVNSKAYNDFYTPSASSIDTVVKLLDSFQSTK